MRARTAVSKGQGYSQSGTRIEVSEGLACSQLWAGLQVVRARTAVSEGPGLQSVRGQDFS